MIRLVSGVILAAAALAAILFLPIVALRVLAVAVAGLAAHEYLRIAERSEERGGQISRLPAWSGRSVLADSRRRADGCARRRDCLATGCSVELLSARGARLAGCSTCWRAERYSAMLRPSIVAPIYTGAPLGMLAVVHATHGWRATLMLIATVIVSDSSQYYAGRSFGRRPLAPTHQPEEDGRGRSWRAGCRDRVCRRSLEHGCFRTPPSPVSCCSEQPSSSWGSVATCSSRGSSGRRA